MLISIRRGTSSNSFRSVISLASLFILLGGMTFNVISAAEEELPRAEEILNRYIEATGGKAAYDKIKSRVIEATMEIAGQGLTLSLTVYAAKPNLAYTILEADAIGRFESGTDGKVVWENSLLKGPAIKKGAERTNALRDSTFDRLVYWKTVYGKAECIGQQSVEGKRCFKVVLTPKRPPAPPGVEKENQPLTLFIDEESSLVSKIESNVVTAAGTIPVEAYLSEYKRVDGILAPHKVITKLLNQERIMTITSIKHSEKIAKGRFEIPDEILALTNRQKRQVPQP